ncbi:hypothetical protein RA19_16975 [Leisingera sp. ANG-M1]|uniref:MarR family winged helix-turn-helix transcriptional regulator n=1 Tax=Leisingera sp. ANG-M1 TaxID=1577895 RepID=UPI000580AFB2|nr:MarR family transcriptional regulator [Leisingera sp. ANG-M1]KIC08992.1 hypothetical protein RA19_16975 [Leisingera sp. ANG-M1]
MPDTPPAPVFEVLTEVAIISQLANAALESCLPQGLIAAHFAVLSHLVRTGDGQTPADIARALQVPKTSFSNTLAGLQKHGLAEARPNPRDGRSKTIWITGQGRKLREDTVAALAPALQELAGRTGPGTFHALLPSLRSLRAEMDAMRNP